MDKQIRYAKIESGYSILADEITSKFEPHNHRLIVCQKGKPYQFFPCENLENAINKIKEIQKEN